MEGITVVSFKESWPGLDKKLRDTDPEKYYFHLFKVILKKGSRGFKHTKIYAPTRSGTSIKFTRINSQEESDQAMVTMLALAKEYNEKYNAGIEIEEEENEHKDK